MIGAGVKMTGRTCGTSITACLHVPEERFAENYEGGLVRYITIQTDRNGWSYGFERRKRRITPLCKAINRCKQDSDKPQWSHVPTGSLGRI